MVQAHYIWGDLPNQVKEFEKEGYCVYEVEGHFDDNKDTVLIYKLWKDYCSNRLFFVALVLYL